MSAVSLKTLEDAQHLLRRLAVSAVRHQFGVAQDGVERRAQLMTLIGKELRLVLACLFKLPAFVLDFVEQPHVLNGDHRLVGESCYEIDLLLSKRFYVGARQEKSA